MLILDTECRLTAHKAPQSRPLLVYCLVLALELTDSAAIRHAHRQYRAKISQKIVMPQIRCFSTEEAAKRRQKGVNICLE